MNKNWKLNLFLIIAGIIIFICFSYLFLYLCNSIEESFKCIGDNNYTYIDLNNNKGKAIDCDKNFQPYLTCELKDGTIIQVKEYKEEIEHLCD